MWDTGRPAFLTVVQFGNQTPRSYSCIRKRDGSPRLLIAHHLCSIVVHHNIDIAQMDYIEQSPVRKKVSRNHQILFAAQLGIDTQISESPCFVADSSRSGRRDRSSVRTHIEWFPLVPSIFEVRYKVAMRRTVYSITTGSRISWERLRESCAF